MNPSIYDFVVKKSAFGYTHLQAVFSEGKAVDYIFLDTNVAYENMIGLHGIEIINKRVTEVLPSITDDPFNWIECFGEVARSGKSKEVEAFSSSLNKWFHMSISSPAPGFCVVVSFDITKQKILELELRKSEETLREYIDNAPDGIFIADKSLSYIDTNSTACSMLGYTCEELHVLKIKDVLAPEDVEAHKKSLLQLAAVNKASRTAHLIKKDGDKITVMLDAVNLSDGKIMAFCKDITQHEKLENEKEQYYSAFQHTSQPILITDAHGNITSANGSFCNMYGYDKDEVMGQNPRILNPGRRVYENLGFSTYEYDTLFKDLWAAVRNPDIRTWKGEVINRRKNNTLVWISLLVNAVYDDDGILQSIIGFPVDMTVSHEIAERNKLQLYKTIADLAELRDDETGNHMRRVGLFTKNLAKQIGKNEKYCDDIEIFSPMHDIGKVGILDSILRAPRKLTDEEFDIMKSHTTLGYNIIKGKPEFEMAAAITMCHHEKYDGTGYPRGIKGENIPLSARITSLCDVYDALRSRRPYKLHWTHEDSVQYIKDNSGKHFDPILVDGFMQIHQRFETIYRELQDHNSSS